MNAILISVDYSDLLALTLPYNRHHFDKVLVVTTNGGKDEQVARNCNADVFATDAFYRDGAVFNKWLALEEGLDKLGRDGWMCVMDADVLWPKDLHGWQPERDYLYSPLRHMHENLNQRFLVTKGPIGSNQLVNQDQVEQSIIPPEDIWWQFPIHRNIAEWAGYTQIFHASDVHLGPKPWYETNWRHAGGADSFFQQKWPVLYKRRPPWNVLHLGEAGKNWCGRATPYIDGTTHPQAEVRRHRTRDFIRHRTMGIGRFDHEKLG